MIWKSQNVSKQLQSPFCDCNWKWFCSCDLIQLLIRYFVATGSQQLFSTGFCENCSVFSDHLLTHPMFHSCTTIHFSPMSHTAWFWLLVSFSISFPDDIILCKPYAAMVTSSFLLLMTSRSPSFDPNFITSLHSLSSSFDPLSLPIIYQQVLLVSISFAFWCPFLLFHQVHQILYRWRLLLCAPTWRLLAHVHFKFQTGSHLHSALYKRSRFNSI